MLCNVLCRYMFVFGFLRDISVLKVVLYRLQYNTPLATLESQPQIQDETIIKKSSSITLNETYLQGRLLARYPIYTNEFLYASIYMDLYSYTSFIYLFFIGVQPYTKYTHMSAHLYEITHAYSLIHRIIDIHFRISILYNNNNNIYRYI